LEGFDSSDTDADIARLHTELTFSPPQTIGLKDQALLDGAAALGWDAAPTQRNAVGCGDCGACGFGCRRGTKLSGQRLHLAMAAQSGARIMPGVRVDRVDFRNGVLSSVEGALHDGRAVSVTASKVVLAAGALRTPLLLHKSAVTHRAVGRNLHLHPTVAVAGRFDRDVLMWRDSMQGARSLEFIRDGILIESAPPHPGLIALAFPWQGAAGLDVLMRDVRHYAPWIGITRDDDAGVVKLTRSGRARIDYRVSARDAGKARDALVAMARLGRASGAQRLVALGTPAAWLDDTTSDSRFDAYLDGLRGFDFGPNRAAVFSAHQMGTARAGKDATSCVCDPWGRVCTGGRANSMDPIAGLYVADASLFPTAVGVNPMVTVMAMAARVARTVHEDTAGQAG
jgi:choline dehydrogenase-like flavoprotein